MKTSNLAMSVFTLCLLAPCLSRSDEPKNGSVVTDEFKSQFNVYTPTRDDIDVILKGGDEAVKRLDTILQNIARQSLTMANYLIQQEAGKTEKREAELSAKLASLETRFGVLEIIPHTPAVNASPATSVLRPTGRLSFEEAKQRARAVKQGMAETEVEALIGPPDQFQTRTYGGAPGVDRWQGLEHTYVWKNEYGVPTGQIQIIYQSVGPDQWVVNNFQVQ